MLTSTTGPETHFVLEALAYVLGAKVYWRSAARGASVEWSNRLILVGGTILGAMIGSKLLHIAQHFDYLVAQDQPQLWLSGKSVLGGLLGGTLGSELAKKNLGWHRPTGDPWVPALAIGLVIGRLGCQLSGTWDQTYGIPTNLPWAWNYGDNIGRHPTALYEIILIAIAFAASRASIFRLSPGASFAIFLVLYCVIRLFLEFLKPPFGDSAADAMPTAIYAGLTAIQWAALGGLVWFSVLLLIRLRHRETC